MATLLDRCNENRIAKLDPALSWREQEDRMIYMLPRVQDWIVNDLPGEISGWNLQTSPEEQLDELVNRFCSGGVLEFERQISPIRHISNGIWELKSADIRLFGWFYRLDIFVCSAGNTAHNVKEYRLYGAYRDEAVRLRAELDLDKPDFVVGDDPNGVVSNFRYPTS